MLKRKVDTKCIVSEAKKFDLDIVENHKLEMIYIILLHLTMSDYEFVRKHFDDSKFKNFVPALFLFYKVGKFTWNRIKNVIEQKKNECLYMAKHHFGFNLLMIKFGFMTDLNIIQPIYLMTVAYKQKGIFRSDLPYVYENVKRIKFYNFDSLRDLKSQQETMTNLLQCLKNLKTIIMKPSEHVYSLKINYSKIFKNLNHHEFHLDLAHAGMYEIPEGIEDLVTHIITADPLKADSPKLSNVIYWKCKDIDGTTQEDYSCKFMPNVQEIYGVSTDFAVNVPKNQAHRIKKARGYIRSEMKYFVNLEEYQALRIKPKDVRVLPNLKKLEINQILKKDVEQIKKEFPKLEIGHLESNWMFADDIFTCEWHFVTPVSEQWNSPKTDKWLKKYHSEYYNGNYQKYNRYEASHSYDIEDD